MQNNRVTNSCYKCEIRSIGCHASCKSYQEFYKKNEELKKVKRLDEAEKHLIDNFQNIKAYKNIKKGKRRIGLW